MHQMSEVMKNIMSDQASVQRKIQNNLDGLSKAMENLGRLFFRQSFAEQSYRRAEQNQTPNRFGYPGRADHLGASTSAPQGESRPQGVASEANTHELNVGERSATEGGEPNIYDQGQLLNMLEKLRVDFKLMPHPSGYKVLEFSLFYREEQGQSTVERVARFPAQCSEAAAHDFRKLRLFASSLTKMPFTWYSRLTSNSVETWKDLEILFHEGFYRAPPDVTLVDFARISQLPSESAEKYIGRFRNLRTRCSTKMSEADCVPMVVRGMSFAMREHFEGHRFRDLFKLTNRVTSYERLLQEKEQRRGASKGTYYKDQLDIAVIFEQRG
ncbi:uncharacterized protein LOC126657023 [Mercurialis annua]|uniref:uncharacterized protein LOC126657023 n=1 Tax=Mercurialis annua TaxID=3986 RepID=UPI00215FBCDB|nr:uncharacterized protein LOC126657023 [Mercurialis annua]